MKKLASIIFAGCILLGQISNAQCPERTEDQWKTYFNEHINELEPIEGIWSYNVTENMFPQFH